MNEYKIKVSDPFVAVIPTGHTIILQSETTYSDGRLAYYYETVLDDNPSKQKIFAVNLKNPQQETQIAWGKGKSLSVSGCIVMVSAGVVSPWSNK